MTKLATASYPALDILPDVHLTERQVHLTERQAVHALLDSLDKNHYGLPLATHANLILILKRDPLLKGIVEYNAFSGRHMLRKAVPVLDPMIP